MPENVAQGLLPQTDQSQLQIIAIVCRLDNAENFGKIGSDRTRGVVIQFYTALKKS